VVPALTFFYEAVGFATAKEPHFIVSFIYLVDSLLFWNLLFSTKAPQDAQRFFDVLVYVIVDKWKRWRRAQLQTVSVELVSLEKANP
jgi:hypothetical protein